MGTPQNIPLARRVAHSLEKGGGEREACTDRNERAAVDPSSSSTYEELDDTPFSISYLDESGANGTYFTDDFTVGGTTIKSLQMGLAQRSTINSGLMGVGYSTNVAAEESYPNIIDVLQEQDLISVKAYSLWLVRLAYEPYYYYYKAESLRDWNVANGCAYRTTMLLRQVLSCSVVSIRRSISAT